MERRSTVYQLSMPPSLNMMYPSSAGGGRHKSKEYSAWQRIATKELMAQRARPMLGAIEIIITLEDRSTAYDPDNRIKAVLDLLKYLGIIEADHHKIVRSVTARIGDCVGASVEISPAQEWQYRAKKRAAA